MILPPQLAKPHEYIRHSFLRHRLVELENGRKFILTPGLSFQVADNADRHRNYSRTGAKFFVVD
jgi:hypothetical protein